jgi:multidrug efflux pump subunit AcrB
MVGALIALLLMGQPFGFMAFLGIISLVGVIISHVIVLFDFIEEKHAEGEPLEEALLDAGIIRLRPVMITVGATVLGLIPLALQAGRSGSHCAMPRSAAWQWPPLSPCFWCRSFTASSCWI